MTYFAKHRTKRTTTFVALPLWPFALAAGVANARALRMAELHSNTVAESAATTGQARGELLAHTHAGAGAGAGAVTVPVTLTFRRNRV